MFFEESSGKIKESLNLELFRNVSVHEFYRFKALITLEQVNKWVLEKNKNINSKITMVGFGKLSLYANKSCGEHAIYFRQWSKWSAM